jgi:hypothetical protein
MGPVGLFGVQTMMTGVGLEGAPGVDDLITDGCRCLNQLVQDRDAAARDVHVVDADAVAGTEALAQARGRGVRIPVDRRRSLQRLEHRRERLERVLVAGQLERVGTGLLALAVGRERGDLGTDAGKDRLGHESESTSAQSGERRIVSGTILVWQ